MCKLKYLLVLLLCLTTIIGYSQSGAQGDGTLVKGKVTDAGGEPLIGAQLRWADTKQATITDVDGNYVIKRVAALWCPISVINRKPSK
jgi:hypothetical protein